MGYTLYELSARGGVEDRYSPYCWKTVSDLAILDVPYDSNPLTFLEIRKDLAEMTGDEKVTVPTLKTEDGYTIDSYKVAEYLAKAHPNAANPLWSTPDGQAFSRFMDIWADTQFAGTIRDLFRPHAWLRLDKDCRDYFIETKLGNNRGSMKDQLKALEDPSKLEQFGVAARSKLQLIEKYLSEKGPFLLGEKPSHADSALFGWYCSSQVHPDVDRLIWKHADLPHVDKWAEAMKKVTKWKSPYTKMTQEQIDELVKEL